MSKTDIDKIISYKKYSLIDLEIEVFKKVIKNKTAVRICGIIGYPNYYSKRIIVYNIKQLNYWAEFKEDGTYKEFRTLKSSTFKKRQKELVTT
ncbi:MAG: hypothetical protein IPQ08_06280 [Chitinophagaceae bacterium]|nr:hypothetical protein [Chitinophagaceae bacterium]